MSNSTAPQQRPGGSLPAEFAKLFEDNHELVYRAAYRITGNAEDAEDVLQTLFLRLLRREYLPDLERSPKAYMHRAAVNIALDILRFRARNVTSGDVENALERSGPSREQEHGAAIDEWLRGALKELNPKAAEIFLLHVEGYENAEIAEMLGTSKGTVAVLLFRARTRLKKLFRIRLGEIGERR